MKKNEVTVNRRLIEEIETTIRMMGNIAITLDGKHGGPDGKGGEITQEYLCGVARRLNEQASALRIQTRAAKGRD